MPTAATFPNIRPTLLLDFANAGRLSPLVTFSRASNATYFDETGILRTAANNVPRFDYNPATLATQGLLIEEARTNSIRNNTMQGAVAGTPGTLPTNWLSIGGGLGTLTQQIVGTGTSAGITYIDIRLSGTTSTTSVGYTFESIVQIAASVGQTWTGSFYVARVAGTNTNISSMETRVVDRDVGGGNIGNSGNNFIASLATSFTRPTITRTLAAVGTAFVSSDIFISFASGVAIDITLRIGLPQLEQGAFATSVIPTTTTALTRAADVASVNTLSPWFNASQSTIYAEWTNIAAAMPSGVLQGIVGIEDGTGGGNFYRIFQAQATGAKASTNMFSGGANPGRLDAGGAYSNATVKAASAFAASDRAISANGGTAVASATGALPVGVNVMYLGHQGVGVNNINGYLRRVTYYPRRLSNAELQAITS